MQIEIFHRRVSALGFAQHERTAVSEYFIVVVATSVEKCFPS